MGADFAGTERFTLRRRLGAGGMGVVYEAFDEARNTVVALKTLRDMRPQALYHLKNEFRVLQGLAHPNLVSLGELIEDDGRWFFTMELIEGVDFLTYVRADAPTEDCEFSEWSTLPVERQVPYDEDRLRSAAVQLASGLAALHDAGKVHRDVKPTNVLVTAEGRLVLLDFGLAIDESAQRMTGPQLVGTLTYMAPEQALAEPVGSGTDWYSFGVVLYEALTGEVPHVGRSAAELMSRKQEITPAPPRARVPAVSRDLDGLCVDLLRVDPGERPNGESVLERLGVPRGGEATPRRISSQLTHSSPFFGRARELTVLHEAFEQARGGQATAVFLIGESGMGKSALIREFTEAVAPEPDHGPMVLVGCCYEREQVPYKALDGAVDVLSQHLRRLADVEVAQILPRGAGLLPRLFPVLGRVEAIIQAPGLVREMRDPQELRTRVFGAFRELVDRIVERRPMVLVIDDFQWADADSIALLADLCRPPDAPPLLLVLSVRPDVELPTLGGNSVEVRLDALPTHEARALAHTLIEQHNLRDRVSPDQVVAEARGHPLYIDEIIRHAALGDSTSSRRPRLEEAIWSRITALPRQARAILMHACVAGEPVSFEILRSACRLSADEFQRHVGLLRVAHVLRMGSARHQGQLEPYHDRVREAVLSHVEADVAGAIHRRLAVAMQASGRGEDRSEFLLRHLEAAGDLKRALYYAQQAAQRSWDALAFDRAAELYRTALRIAELVRPEHAEESTAEGRPLETLSNLRVRLAESLVNAGRGGEAADAFLAAAEGSDPSDRLELLARATHELIICGHIERGLDSLAALLAVVDSRLPSSPRRALVSALWHRARVRLRGNRFTAKRESQVAREDLLRLDVLRAAGQGLGMVDTIRGADFNARFLLHALRTGEASRLAIALGMEVIYHASRGDRGLRRARALREQLRRIAADDPRLEGWIELGTAAIAYFEGRFHEAVEVCGRAETFFAEQVGATYELNNTRLFQLFALRHAGRFREARTRVDRYLVDAERRGDRYAATSCRRSANYLWLAEGRSDRAHADLAIASWQAPAGAFHVQHWYLLEARGELHLYENTAQDGLLELDPLFDGLERSLLTRVQIVRVIATCLLGRMLVAAGEPVARAEVVAKRLLRESVPYSKVWGRVLLASCAARRGDVDRAHEQLRAAIDGAREHEMAAWLATCRLRLANLVGGDDGARLSELARGWASEQGVADLDGLARVLAPGFADETTRR